MTEYYYLGMWDRQGVPDYKMAVGDVIDPELIERIGISLPESKSVPTYNPQYLSNNKKNIIIRTSNPNFTGADIWVTFIDEGAGYTNTLGYYVYNLNTDTYDIPTKKENDIWVPLKYEDRDALDLNGKSILKKTIIFPNASIKGDGGNMRPGDKVKLFYDINDKTKKFPNNTGVGFFLIPNGFNQARSNITNKNDRIYTDSIFNSVDGGVDSAQSILFYDVIGSDDMETKLILGFEDIMRPSGDKDFNDLIIRVTYTPSYSCSTSDMIILSNGKNRNQTELIANKTGLYLNLSTNDLQLIRNMLGDNIKIQHTIEALNEEYRDSLKKIFDNLLLENEGSVQIDNRPTDIVVTYKIPRTLIGSYVYFVMSIKNRDQISTLDPKVANIVNFQDYYINGEKIVSEKVEISEFSTANDNINNNINNNTNPVLISIDARPAVTTLSIPYAMGDPHIKTIYGEEYMIHNLVGTYNMYDNDEIKIDAKLDHYSPNIGHKIYEKLTFIKYLEIKSVLKDATIIVDMFNPNVFYDKDKKPIKMKIEYFKLTKIEDYLNKDHDISEYFIKTEKVFKEKRVKYVTLEFDTFRLGKVVLVITYCPMIRDYINGFSIFSKNLLMTSAKGALIYKT